MKLMKWIRSGQWMIFLGDGVMMKEIGEKKSKTGEKIKETMDNGMTATEDGSSSQI